MNMQDYVEHNIGRAWLDFRIRLGDVLAQHIDEPGPLKFIVHGPPEDSMHVQVGNGKVYLTGWGEDGLTIPKVRNADRAAYVIADIAENLWGIVHPAFLEIDLPGLEMDDPDAIEIANLSYHASVLAQIDALENEISDLHAHLDREAEERAALESELWHWREYFSMDEQAPTLMRELEAARKELAAFHSLARQQGWDPSGELERGDAA
jgi:hypothetical protein